MVTAEKLIKLLGLKSHPEGGYYRETYRSDEIIEKGAFPFLNRGFFLPVYG